jgi:hypothetical protein
MEIKGKKEVLLLKQLKTCGKKYARTHELHHITKHENQGY